MEFIVQLFRALANRQRIKILRLLSVLGETSVSQIAGATGVELSRVSAHLKVLSAAGLLWRRRSGRAADYYMLDHSPSRGTSAVENAIEIEHAVRWAAKAPSGHWI